MICRLARLLVPSLLVFALVSPAWGWGKGHGLIRTWAVDKLPGWQRDWIGESHLERLCTTYTSLQDQHAGGKAPHLDAYCMPPGPRVSLHDVNPAGPSVAAKRWYLEQIMTRLAAEETDEAMKFLGVLCHWNEDPGCPSAHSSPVSEDELRRLIPPPPDKQRLNYLYGYGGIADVGKYSIPDEPYRPKLLGSTVDEIAARIYQHQRLLERRAASYIVPLVQDMVYGDGGKADEIRAQAAFENARHVADVIYTVVSVAADCVRPDEAETYAKQRLNDWLSDFSGVRTGHPYYVVPYLVDQSMDANRQLHPLAFSGTGSEVEVAFGFGMGAPFSLDYTIAPGSVFDRFTCRVGLHPTAGPDGAVAFAIDVDGENVHTTREIASGEPPVAISVALPKRDVVKLSLRTVPVDPAASLHNLSVWGEPTLHRAPLPE